jgi:Fe(3+) dicitrate transport protein
MQSLFKSALIASLTLLFATTLHATSNAFQVASAEKAETRSSSDSPVSNDTLRSEKMPQIEVIGLPERFARIPGSASVISIRQIQTVAAVSSNEVFRSISGLHVVEEEGLGLRANIGIRGLDPDKSRTVLMLEDGIPIALAPYGEPEMYYTPSMDRMSGVEVLKGSGSIMFGPQTFGGVINYLTANPPPVPTTTAHVRGGEGGYFVGRFGYGTTYGNTGFQSTYLYKRGENVGLLDYELHDFNSKIKLVLADNSFVGVKLGLYNETSNSTYIGLTQPMYDSGNYDFTHLSPNDRLDVRRYSGSVTHDYYFSENLRLKTTAFGYTTTRNWGRQDFDNVENPNRTYDRIVGDPSAGAYNAIYFRQTTGNRNRQFEVMGLEPRLSANFFAGDVRHELDFGVRYLYERAFEQRIDGTPERVTSGTLRDDEIRTGRAVSAYVQNRLFLNDKLTVTPGLRVEYFHYERDILRAGNQERNIVAESDIVEFIPGIGFNLQYGEGSSLFGGVHRGFGPPRTKDAISAQTVNGQPVAVAEDLDAERSWNIELGTRLRISQFVNSEITAFYLDFSNQIIPVSESSGGVGQGLSGLINGGETRHLGLETSVDANIGKILDLATGIQFATSVTYTNATFSSDRFVNIGGGNTENIKGNKLPYAPELLVNTRFDVQFPFGLGLGLNGTYIAKQYGDTQNLEIGSNDGRQGSIPAYFVLNGSLSYKLPQLENANLSLSVKNLFDERYIVSRRPQGIRVGLPRFVSLGFDISI